MARIAPIAAVAARLSRASAALDRGSGARRV
jgi:hypothetical protein